MNKVLELDEENLMISCEPAVTLSDLIQLFKTRKDAFAAVPKIIQEGIIPVALEYVL
jgi:FAD/FMN-containing dehydrogenase